MTNTTGKLANDNMVRWCENTLHIQMFIQGAVTHPVLQRVLQRPGFSGYTLILGSLV